MPANLATSRLHVLVVDDDRTFAMLAAEYLGQAGCIVSRAADGARAFEMLDRMRIDLAIIDLSMPTVDGLRLIGLIRGSPRLRQLAILVVSGAQSSGAFAEAMALGANAVETKPVDWSRFPDRVVDVWRLCRSPRRDPDLLAQTVRQVS